MSGSNPSPPQSPSTLPAVVLPIAEGSSVSSPAAERDACNKFHISLGNSVEAELRQSADNMMAYDLAYTRSMKMLDHNIDNEQKPMLGRLANAVYTYRDPTVPFQTLVDADPLVAVWTSHVFICCQYKVFLLFCC